MAEPLLKLLPGGRTECKCPPSCRQLLDISECQPCSCDCHRVLVSDRPFTKDSVLRGIMAIRGVPSVRLVWDRDTGYLEPGLQP